MEDLIRIGKINKNIIKRFSLKLNDGETVYILRKDLDSFARRFPSTYLAKISECKNILRSPMYGAYKKKEKKLYLVKEYIKDSLFHKAGIEIDLRRQPHMVDIFLLTNLKSAQIVDDETNWLLLSLQR